MPDGITMTMAATAARFTSRLQGLARRVTDDGGAAVKAQVQDLRQILVQTSPVDTGYFRDHWGPVVQHGSPLAWGVDNPTPYGPTLEYGGYRGVGLKTVQVGGGDLGAGFVAGGGIYSKQAPLGFMRRGLAQVCPDFRRRIENVLRRAWVTRDMGGGWPAAGTVRPAETAPLLGDLGNIFGIDIAGGATRGGLSPTAQRAVSAALRSIGTRRGSRGRRG